MVGFWVSVCTSWILRNHHNFNQALFGKSRESINFAPSEILEQKQEDSIDDIASIRKLLNLI